MNIIIMLEGFMPIHQCVIFIVYEGMNKNKYKANRMYGCIRMYIMSKSVVVMMLFV